MRCVSTIAALAAGLLLAGADVQAQSINGGGSSFIGPMMSKWSRDFEKAKEIKVNYNPTGSGSGIRQFLEKEIDFACTDAPLTEEQLKQAQEAGGPVLHIPLVLGGVVAAYNLPDIKEPIRLTGPVLADIFLGNIKKWNDPALKEINAGVALPALEILVMHRSEASGSTYIFTDYLSKVSKEWKDKAGVGTTVKWPVGTGEKGNEGLAAAVNQRPGAIGYVELLHALQKNLKHAKIKNREGNFVQGSLETVSAAAEGALTDIPDDLRFSLTHAPGKEAYPISGTTWALIFAKQTGDRAKRVYDFLGWATHDGQESATDLYYARLPRGLVQKIEAKLKEGQAGK